MSGQKIIEGLKQAVAGDFARVTIDGQVWVREKPPASDLIAKARAEGFAEAKEALRPLATIPLWRDHYPDGPDILCDQRLPFTAAQVRAARECSPVRWQPADTAPKDGTHILVCRGPYSEHWTFNQSPPAVVHYWTHPGANEDGFYLSNGGTDDDLPFEFTHWQPFAASPKAST